MTREAENDRALAAATPSPRGPGIRLQARRSARSGRLYWYGDVRRYRDVGGRVEPLRAPGTRAATSDRGSVSCLCPSALERTMARPLATLLAELEAAVRATPGATEARVSDSAL